MKKATGLRTLGSLAIAGTLALAAGPATAAGSDGQAAPAYTCSGGEIPSGTYSRVTVTGPCTVPAGAVITVVGNIDVAPGAVLDAQSAPATISVGHNVTGGAGSLVGLGCQPPSYTGNSAHTCEVLPAEHSTIRVTGNVSITDAAAVLLNGITVDGNVALEGGGGSPIPWSIKNNTIGRNLSVSGQTVEWLGVMFNKVAGNANLSDITVLDREHPESAAVFVVRNTIGRNLNCTGLAPTVSGGFNPFARNVVGRNANGQCAALV